MGKARAFTDPMDAADQELFVVQFRQLLATGETITLLNSVNLDAAATAANVVLLDSGGQTQAIVDDPDTAEVNTAIRFWVEVTDGNENDAVFDAPGIRAQITINVSTSFSRKLERSVEVRICNPRLPA